MSNKLVTVWVTKYAMTKGILEKKGELTGNGICEVGMWRIYYGEGREWHRNKEAAIARAKEMQVARIASLQKQLSALEARRFE